MKKKTLKTAVRSLLVLLIAAAVMAGVLPRSQAQAERGDHQASHITRLDGSLGGNYMSYLDSGKVFPLSDRISADQEISVIVTVDGTSLLDAYEATDKTMDFADFALNSREAMEIRSAVAQRRAEITDALEKQGVAYTLGEDYSVLLCGFELLIRAEDYAAACMTLGTGERAIVGEEYAAAETELVENVVNVYETGIFNSADVVYDGTGMVVAVLDTGLDSNHSAFSVNNFTSTHLGLTYEQVAAVVNQTVASELHGGLGVDDVYINEKVPFGYDYADNDPDVYSTHNNHGTHVSGVIVGKDDTITGVAPNAQLVSMKVFSDIMDTARSSWILSALEDCVVLGVDVINMSLGTACGFSTESDEEVLSGVYDRIREAGISLVVAASNSYSSAYGSEANGNLGLTSNPDTGTVGSPGTYAGTLSVASINGTETPYILFNDTIIYFEEANSGTYEELFFCDALLGDQESLEIPYVIVPGVGRSADYTGLDVSGKIALVRRGDNTFEEKAMIAQAQGAAGIIVYNNVSGEIKMNVGDATLAVCSISQDDGEMLVAAGGGTITISKQQTSGPFISDFSSWGPTPGLEIKPEITAHGGNILSSVTGGGYDRLSGTSMACPNVAGVVVLLRQYVTENFPEIANDNVAVNAMVNKLMMSTADIVLNTNGSPYAVRKQGAGLANLLSSVNTTAYITTYDENGNAMDKTKLELGDDIAKNGIYEMRFSVVNFGDTELSYDIGAFVMTEGVSDTKTNAGKTTVTEEAYLLENAVVDITSVNNGTLKDTRLTVAAGTTADVTVTITLGDEDKAYLDASFENGMYVEGFITLTAVSGTEISLNVPYLAYYGDWTLAPMFDLTFYETNADELDMGINEEDKLKADAYATRLVGGITGDYVSYLGTYYFVQDPGDMVISANEDYIALSNQQDSVHSLRFAWTGMLRNAERVEITITDDTTGEVVFETVDYDVRKSYGDGGSIYPANVEIEFDTMDYNLSNNTTYTVRIAGYMDYSDGGVNTNKKNVYEFPLTVDFEAPTVTDVEFYSEYDNTQKKNRLYAKVAVYDNHFAMCMQMGHVEMGADEDGNATPVLTPFALYMTPVYSNRNSTTYVTFELTDHIYDIKESSMNKNTFVLTCYDYALNYATYEIGLPDNYLDFCFEGLEEGITLSPNEVFSLEPLVYPDSEWAELLEFTSSKSSVARVVNNKVVAASAGSAVIKVRDPATNQSITFKVTVLSENDEGYRRYDKPVADVFRLNGYTVNKAYYVVDNNEADIGYTGDTRFFEGNYSLTMYPSESVVLNYDLDAYYPNDTTVEFESSNDQIVKIDAAGNVTAVAEGFASVTIKVMQDGKSTYYSETVSVEVKDPYVTTGASLTHYFGLGGTVTIPGDMHLTEIGSFAFANFEYVDKTPEELEFDDAENTKQWYIGESTITKVVIPEGIKKINAYAFANLTGLEEIVLPSTMEAIEYGAFYGCTALQKITFSGENNVIIISQSAFENCDLRGTIDMTGACVISDYAFAGNQNLEGVTTSDRLLSIGQYAFAGCKKLTDVTIGAAKVKYGIYAFTDCESLKDFYVNAAVLPEGMFYECDTMESVTIGPDVNDIGEFAFRSTNISAITVEAGNEAFKPQTDNYVLSADGKTLVAVAPTIRGEFTADNIGGAAVTAIADGAFSHCTKITSVALPSVTTIGDYGFGSSDGLTEVKLGKLEKIGEYAFFETAITEMPDFDANTEIGKYAFAFTQLTSVTIPDGMTVAEGMFSECLQLENVVIGDNVTLGSYSFQVNKDYSFSVESETLEDGSRRFYYVFQSPLTSLTIGDNAVIGDGAFLGAASLESVTLGENATIGYMAFYNNCSLKEIDLSKAASIGDYAFSGDVYYVCVDESMAYAAVSSDGYYIYTYHAPALESIDLSQADSIGEYAFAYCRQLTDVNLGEKITEIAPYAFAGCETLANIDLSKIITVGDYAFIENKALTALDLSAAESVGDYAFVYCDVLTDVKLSEAGTDIGEGTFSYCEQLTNVENLGASRNLSSYAFAYTALTEADLTAAENIGDLVFLKEERTPFAVTLGTNLISIGDNPFAFCALEPFGITEVTSFNGVEYTAGCFTVNLSDTVAIIDGSLYCKTVNGYELIAFAGEETEDCHVADGTVRIAAYAFAGSDVKMVTLPYTVAAIGHKAFFGAENLETVVFTSFKAPILEEEFDSTYYESLEHIPGSGDFGTYTDYDGNEVAINGTGLVPYFMWNATGGMYSNVFYGANFVDYVGYVTDKLIMVRPANGREYDSWILSQYFDITISGPTAADDTTLAAIEAINALPERVVYEDKALVEAAREAYTKIATTEQQALVTNYGTLISAEQRIIALTPVEEVPVEEETRDNSQALTIVLILMMAALVLFTAFAALKSKGIPAKLAARKAKKNQEAAEEATEAAEENTEE